MRQACGASPNWRLADLHDVVVLPGAVEALASLASAKNAIATSCTVPLAEARIAAQRSWCRPRCW